MEKLQLDYEVKEAGEGSRVLRFVGSTDTRDRSGDEIDVRGWDVKSFRKNPVFLWAHKRDVLPVGRAIDVRVEDRGLVFDVEFAKADINPFAEQVYQHYKQGFLKGVSVGFLPVATEKIDTTTPEEAEKRRKNPDLWVGRRFKKQQLLELSAVPVPCNPDATLTAKAIDDTAAPTPEMAKALDEWVHAAAPDAATLRIEEIEERITDLAETVGQLAEQIECTREAAAERRDGASGDTDSDLCAAICEAAPIDLCEAIEVQDTQAKLYAAVFGGNG